MSHFLKQKAKEEIALYRKQQTAKESKSQWSLRVLVTLNHRGLMMCDLVPMDSLNQCSIALY